MKGKIIILIGFLATVAIIALLAMQLYWINTAARIKEQNFEHNVSNAVTNVIYKLEMIETAKIIKLKLKNSPQDSAYFNSVDSLKRLLSKYYHNSKDRLELQLKFDRLLKKSYSGNIATPNFLNIEHSQIIENRINARELDSLLNIELRNKGIKTPYEFGIFSPHRHMLLLQKTGNYTSELLEKAFKYNLFPGDIYMPPEYLHIYFPKRITYILTHILGILLLSALLVGILVFIFTFTIITLVRQKKLSELKSDLINNLTHEFKTPISTISIACEALNDKDIQKSSSNYNNYVNIIKEENRRLGVMAENVLQAAIIDKGHLRLKKLPMSLHDLIKNVINNISIQVEKRNGFITAELDAYNDKIHADQEHLASVIYNLLDNANKYSPNNPRIKVKTENIEEGIIISVSDNGIGISKANQKKIFEALYRVPTGNIHDTKGYGLGLGYVKAIVEKHGGSISVESELKKGTTFKVLLPFY